MPSFTFWEKKTILRPKIETAQTGTTISSRPPQLILQDPTGKLAERAELKMKTWLHIVARTKTIPKDFVCGEDCEQRSIYGSLFDGHPLNHVKSEDINDEKTD